MLGEKCSSTLTQSLSWGQGFYTSIAVGNGIFAHRQRQQLGPVGVTTVVAALELPR